MMMNKAFCKSTYGSFGRSSMYRKGIYNQNNNLHQCRQSIIITHHAIFYKLRFWRQVSSHLTLQESHISKVGCLISKQDLFRGQECSLLLPVLSGVTCSIFATNTLLSLRMAKHPCLKTVLSHLFILWPSG